MSEHQCYLFHAVDGPVSAKNLEFMEKQSSRAEITPWSFEVEYDYSDFGGDALEMLRRGYDMHLHYANFGIRTLMIRLPQGFPNPSAAQHYLDDEGLSFHKDPKGPGGTLEINPFYESCELDQLGDLDEFLEKLIPLRAEILDGDLRPLYLAHLAISCDSNHDRDETTEAPVPHGIGQLTAAQEALAEFYEIDDSLLAAVSEEIPKSAIKSDSKNSFQDWIQQQPEPAKNDWLSKLMADSSAPVRAELVAKFRKDQPPVAWPVVSRGRTMTELETVAEGIAQKAKQKREVQDARKRAQYLTQIAADPQQTLRGIEKLIALQSTTAYQEIARLLTDVNEALAGGNQSELAKEHARQLKAKYPTRRTLIAALRKTGFISK